MANNILKKYCRFLFEKKKKTNKSTERILEYLISCKKKLIACSPLRNENHIACGYRHLSASFIFSQFKSSDGFTINAKHVNIVSLFL